MTSARAVRRALSGRFTPLPRHWFALSLIASISVGACSKPVTPADLAQMVAESDRLATIEAAADQAVTESRRAASDASMDSFRQRRRIEDLGYTVEWDYDSKRIERVYARGALVYER